MSFGLTKAPAVFQALKNDVLLSGFVFLYVDNILTFSRTLVLQWLLENRQVS